MYAAACEYDFGEGECEGGGLLFVGLFDTPDAAIAEVMRYYMTEYDPAPCDEYPEYWSRADVWTYDGTDEEEAHIWVLDAAYVEGDILHVDSDMWR